MTAKLRRRAGAVAALTAVMIGVASISADPGAAAEPADPDWPCVQRKVPQISIGQMWAGPMPQGNWRDDPQIKALAASLAARRTPVEEIGARAAEFAAAQPADARAEALAELFAGVLAHIQAERGQVIAGIGRYARHQAEMAARIEAKQQELADLEAAPNAERDWDRIEELQDTLAWDTRIFKERAQSLTYVCETPVLLEQRAFSIARALAEHL